MTISRRDAIRAIALFPLALTPKPSPQLPEGWSAPKFQLGQRVVMGWIVNDNRDSRRYGRLAQSWGVICGLCWDADEKVWEYFILTDTETLDGKVDVNPGLPQIENCWEDELDAVEGK